MRYSSLYEWTTVQQHYTLLLEPCEREVNMVNIKQVHEKFWRFATRTMSTTKIHGIFHISVWSAFIYKFGTRIWWYFEWMSPKYVAHIYYKQNGTILFTSWVIFLFGKLQFSQETKSKHLKWIAFNILQFVNFFLKWLTTSCVRLRSSPQQFQLFLFYFRLCHSSKFH